MNLPDVNSWLAFAFELHVRPGFAQPAGLPNAIVVFGKTCGSKSTSRSCVSGDVERLRISSRYSVLSRAFNIERIAETNFSYASSVLCKSRIFDAEFEFPFHGPAVEHRDNEHGHDFDCHAAKAGDGHRDHDVAAASGGS